MHSEVEVIKHTSSCHSLGRATQHPMLSLIGICLYV